MLEKNNHLFSSFTESLDNGVHHSRMRDFSLEIFQQKKERKERVREGRRDGRREGGRKVYSYFNVIDTLSQAARNWGKKLNGITGLYLYKL